MADRLNKVYAEGLTRFQTRGRSTSAIQSPNIDSLLSKYTGRKDAPASKRLDIERLAAGLGRLEQGNAGIAGRAADIASKITRAEKEIMSRSTDRFLGRANNLYEEKKFVGGDYVNELQGRGRPDPYNMPLPEPRGTTDIYERLGKYEGVGRLNKFDVGGADLYSKYDIPSPSKNLDFMKKELELKALQNDYAAREKGYPSDLSLYRNQKTSDRFGGGLQTEYNPKTLLKQLQQEPRKDPLHGRQFGKELNRDYSRQIARGFGGGHGLQKQLLAKQYARGGLTKDLNKDYLKDYSAALGKEAGLARLKASQIGKNIGSKDYARTIDMGKYDRYDNLRGNAYGENTPSGLTRKQDPLAGYRGSMREY